jgi:F0F1-type ATP synthase membrane subunit a
MDSHEVSNSIFHINEAIPSIAPHVFARVGPFAITNTTTTVFFIALICAIVAIVLRKPKQKPGIFQNTIEYLYEVILGLVMQIIGDEKKAKQAVPYIAAILVYILISNLLPLVLGILPLTVLQGGEHITLLRGTTTDFNTTFALAVAIILILQIIFHTLSKLSKSLKVSKKVFLKGGTPLFLSLLV